MSYETFWELYHQAKYVTSEPSRAAIVREGNEIRREYGGSLILLRYDWDRKSQTWRVTREGL